MLIFVQVEGLCAIDRLTIAIQPISQIEHSLPETDVSVSGSFPSIEQFKTYGAQIEANDILIVARDQLGNHPLQRIKTWGFEDPKRVIIVIDSKSSGSMISQLEKDEFEYFLDRSRLEDDYLRVKLKNIVCKIINMSGTLESENVEISSNNKVKKVNSSDYSLIAIGSSTGGPEALNSLLPSLVEITHLPIVITQHMPEGFTENLAPILGNRCQRKVVNGPDNHRIELDNIYLADGGKHLIVKKHLDGFLATSSEKYEEEPCKPSFDVMLSSIADSKIGRVLTIVLTGMGSDGTRGIGLLKDKQLTDVLCQDKSEATVWGMPGSVVKAGLSDKELTIKGIISFLQSLSQKGKL